jgi:hypothetical protein
MSKKASLLVSDSQTIFSVTIAYKIISSYCFTHKFINKILEGLICIVSPLEPSVQIIGGGGGAQA